MAYGGGTFLARNKVVPGTYINVVGATRATATLGDRGVVAVALELEWGADNQIIEVTDTDFYKNSMRIFGFDYTDPRLFALREIFRNAKKALVYKSNSSSTKAECDYATAKCSGIRGNDINIRIASHEDHYEQTTQTTTGALKIVADTTTPTSTQIRLKDVTPTPAGYTPAVNDYVLYVVDRFAVSTHFVAPYNTSETLVDTQIVSNVSELVDNDWVIWKKTTESGGNSVTNDLALTAGMRLTGGSHVIPQAGNLQEFLNLLEPYAFNTLTVDPTGVKSGSADVAEATILDLFKNFTIRMRDETGAKFQFVCYGKTVSYAPDHEGIINVWTRPKPGLNSYSFTRRYGSGNAQGYVDNVLTKDRTDPSLVFWVAGAEAACPVNATVGSRAYDGELVLEHLTTQAELEEAINAGHFVMHQNGSSVIVLSDINSLTTTTSTKNNDFKLNQVIRVLDENSTAIAKVMGQKYYDKYNNNDATRRAIKADLTAILQQLADLQAIERPENNDWSNVVTVDPVDADRQAVDITETFKVTVAINKSYITVYVV